MAGPAFGPNPQAAWRNVEGHVFIITPDNRQHELDGEVEALVFDLCAERPMGLDALVLAVTEEFDVDEQTCRSDIERFVTDLVDRGVMVRFSE